MSGGLRLLLLVAGTGAAVVLFVIFRGSDDDDTPSVTPPPATVTSTVPRPPPAPKLILIPINTSAVTRRTIPRGRQVVLVISGPAGEEIHLHGYDVTRHIGQDGTVRLPFRATIPGRFELELEASHRQIADLTVK
jgi:hypothetical protein